MCPNKIIRFLPKHPVPGAYPYEAFRPETCDIMKRATQDSLSKPIKIRN